MLQSIGSVENIPTFIDKVRTPVGVEPDGDREADSCCALGQLQVKRKEAVLVRVSFPSGHPDA